MINTLYIGKYKDKLCNPVNVDALNCEDLCNRIDVPDTCTDYEVDYKLDYMCREALKSYPNYQVILIDLDWFSINDYLGARLAHHIRLTDWENEEIKSIPIILLREDSIDITANDVMSDDLFIFSGKGAFFSNYQDLFFESVGDSLENSHSIKNRLEDFIQWHCDDFEYVTYLNSLKFSEQQEDSHSITNQWGAIRLAANAGYNPEEIDYKWPPKLYFKYLQENFQFEIAEEKIEIPAKVLLIDDNADKGWEKVLKKIFKYTESRPYIFTVINERVKNFDALSNGSKKLIQEEDFDLYLVDLRLNGSNEDNTTDTWKLSGSTVLQEIKKINAGNQVIIFTASNKAWNMRTLLNGENAADGYYIKESPLNASNKSFGQHNTISLLHQVNLSLKRNYHKQVWVLHKEIEKNFEINKGLLQEETLNEINNQLKISFRILRQNQADDLDYVMVTYFRILEILSEYYIDKSNREDYSLFYKTGKIVKFCKFNKGNGRYTLQDSYEKGEKESYFSTSNKVMAIMCENLGFDLKMQLSDFKNVFSLSQKRNNFIHPNNRASYITPDTAQIVKWTKTLKQILVKLS